MDFANDLEPIIVRKAHVLADDLRALVVRLRSDGCHDRAVLVEDAYTSAQQIIHQMNAPVLASHRDLPYHV